SPENNQLCKTSAFYPKGCLGLSFDPVMNPSSEIDISITTFPMQKAPFHFLTYHLRIFKISSRLLRSLYLFHNLSSLLDILLYLTTYYHNIKMIKVHN